MAERDTTTERNIEPTAHRLADARRRGSVARSAELSAHATLLAGAGAAAMLGPRLGSQLVVFMQTLLDPQVAIGDPSQTASLLWRAAGAPLTTFAAAILLMLLATLAVNLVQVGFLFASQRVSPDMSRLNPVDGMLRIFSARSVWRLALTVLKVTLAGLLGALMLQSNQDTIARTAAGGPLDIVRTAWRLSMQLAIPLLGVLLVTGLLDWAFQRYQHRSDLQMSRQEFLDEMKRNQSPGATMRRGQADAPASEGGEDG